MRHRRLDPQTFQALQMLMAKGGLSVGERLAGAIAERRKELGLSPATLAQRLELSPADVAAMEDGGIELSAAQLVQLADALGVDLVWFIEHEPSLLAGRGPRGVLDIWDRMPDPREGLDLMTAFTAIKDPQARKAVLALAQRFAADDGGPTEGEEE